jgi:hypothetical protein
VAASRNAIQPKQMGSLASTLSNNMSSVEHFEWTFSPSDYFEDVVDVAQDDYVMTIANGKVKAMVDSAVFERSPFVREQMEKSLNDRFMAVQLLTHRPYQLSKSSRTRVHDDGHRDAFIECEPGHIVLTGGIVDITVTDAHGNVISDSRRKRLQRKRDLSELVARHRGTDQFVDIMLKSYDAAVRDPQNELVHLYEVRDAISSRFGGKSASLAALGISATDWSRIGQLCNDEPLRQGRHRGEAGLALRDATESELTEARSIARSFLEAYLNYIDGAVAGGAGSAG